MLGSIGIQYNELLLLTKEVRLRFLRIFERGTAHGEADLSVMVRSVVLTCSTLRIHTAQCGLNLGF